jgi:hypothetical protein
MSVNTSPNMMNNKRRRSTVKMDNDDGGGDMNGGQLILHHLFLAFPLFRGLSSRSILASLSLV